MTALLLENIVKRFDTTTILRQLNLMVQEGQVYGLLGANGAGKSTLIHLIMGFLYPDSGRIEVFGKTPTAMHGQIGYLPERLRYHTHCSAREYLTYMGNFGGQRGPSLASRVNDLLELVGLTEAADKRMRTYSKGMTQRVGIAQALLADPQLLLIDEPSSGLDPQGQLEMRDLLLDLRSQGHTILICSHQLDEIEAVCNRVGILVQGALAAETDLAQLTGTNGIVLTLKETPTAALDFGLRSIDPSIVRDDRFITVPENNPALQGRLLQLLLDEGYTVSSLQPTLGNLRDLYLHVVSGKEPPAEMQPQAPLAILDSLLANEEQQ